MVVKMMRWPTWPSRKLEARIVVQRLEGLKKDGDQVEEKKERRLVVEVKWKGEKGIALRPLRRKRAVKRNLTQECVGFCADDDDGVGCFQWNEDFTNVCSFSGQREGLFLPWEVALTVFNVTSEEGLENKFQATGTAVINLAEFVSTTTDTELQIHLPLTPPTASPPQGTMQITLGLTELRTIGPPLQQDQRTMVPLERTLSCMSSSGHTEELTGLRARLRNVRLLQSGGKKKHSFGEETTDSDAAAANNIYSEGGESFRNDEAAAAGLEFEAMADDGSQPSLNYAVALAYTNFAQGSALTNIMSGGEGEEWSEWIYFNNRKLDDGGGSFQSEQSPAEFIFQEHPLKERLKSRLFLPWRKRKLGFGSSKVRVKGEPLLKKHYGEEGGDDIDFDRRQLSSSSSDESNGRKSEECSTTSRSSFSEFGDNGCFSVGSWETKEVVSRDGKMKLQTQVFFASIDQRHERAAGESACTALVAIIANWLQSNQYEEAPIKSVFDDLIRDGSLQWRNLCENEEYRQRFPDKHFDLETVLRANICPLTVVPEKSFIGFFHPEEIEEGAAENFNFLHGAMSFDSIWEEISRNNSSPASGELFVYIVSWNDHFFILKVDQDAYYIIDTLGERLFEGCNQAYILKFDKDTTIELLPKPAESSSDENSTTKDKAQATNSSNSHGEKSAEAQLTIAANLSDTDNSETEEKILWRGKEACKEYIKSFLAAIPIRELQADLKKGLMASTPLHHRLQVEFHYTQLTTNTGGCS
ncbi:unnamed protein product [Linum tenue]|uniref:C2 NT-type domain-containing protein n=1 Tax=Linum tenue TaxID=586396 RepID=A0AAV0M8T9_9ROSI|nr:unnamed protein product [Linum tenue]